MLDAPPLLVGIDDDQAERADLAHDLDHEAFLAQGDPGRPLSAPQNEWQSIAINYTLRHHGDPKGVVLHHRGAYLNACAGALIFQLGPRSIYLWTLPMFHCNGWSHTWAVTLSGGTHVCLRKVQPDAIHAAIAEHAVTHLSAAPVVMSMLIHAEHASVPAVPVSVITGGAAPPSAVIAAMEARGFSITHAYGMTESYGPSTLCLWQPGVDELPLEARAQFMSRQGVAHPMLEEATVLDTDTGRPVPADGRTLGELVVRGNTVMKGYLHNPEATVPRWPTAGCTPATWPCCTRTATWKSRTGPRTSSFPAARTSARWRSRKCSTSTPRWSRPRWWRARIRAGARHPTRSSPCGRMPYPEPRVTIWSAGAASAWRTSRHRGM